jgi:hypothetical protein
MDEQTEEKFLTKKSFSTMIESFVYRNKQSYMDAIVHLCEENGLELEDIKKYLSPTIVEHLEAEARQLHFLPQQNTLDV